MTQWTITIVAPTGTFDAQLHIDGQSGEMAGKAGSGPMEDLVLSETAIAWSTKIERPMPMKLKFRGEIDGTQMTGTVKFGMFASGTFSGHQL